MFTWPRGDFRISTIHPGCCTRARILLRCEMVSCKHKMTTSFSVKSVCRWTGTGSTCRCNVCDFEWHTCVFYQHEVNLQITKYEITHHHVNMIQNQKVIPVWNSCPYEFSLSSAHAWTSVILARKHDNRHHSTTSLSKNITVVETSYLMLEISAFCGRGRPNLLQ